MEITLIYGSSGSGKTTCVGNYVLWVQSLGWTVGGILSPGKFTRQLRSHFLVRDIETGEERELCQRGLHSDIEVGPFGFLPAAIDFGRNAIERSLDKQLDLLVIDEVGPLELQNRVWAPSLHKVLASKTQRLILTVRPQIIARVTSCFLQRQKFETIAVVDFANKKK